MELRQLRYFVAVSERLNFSRAARAMHVTQSTISHQIKQLEHEFGYELFERSLHHVRLTERGEILLPGIVRMLKELDETIQRAKAGVDPVREHVRIVVGVHFIVSAVLPGALKQFTARCPRAAVSIDENASNRLMGIFERGDHELAIGVDQADAPYARTALCEEELVLAVAADHALARRKRMRMVELHGERLVLPNRSFPYRWQIDRCCEIAGAKPLVVAEFDNPNTLACAVAEQGVGGIIAPSIPGWLADRGLVTVHLEDPTPTRSIVCYLRDRPLSAAAKILVEIIRDQIHEVSRRHHCLGLRPYSNGAQSVPPYLAGSGQE